MAIDYESMLTKIDLSPLLRAQQLGDQREVARADIASRNAQTQLAQNKMTAQLEEDVAYRAALEEYKASPTPDRLRDIAMRFPKQQDALTAGAKAYTEAQRTDLLSAGFGTLGALAAGKTDLAIKTLTERRTALANSGINTDQTDAAIQLIKDGKVQDAKAYISYAMSGLVGADHAASVMNSLGIGQKAENDERRIDIAERRAEASIAQGDARLSLSERAADRADRAAARAERKGAGAGAGGHFEYRVVNGALQKRRKR